MREPRTLSLKDCANALGVTAKSVGLYVRRGLLPLERRIGQVCLVDRTAFEHFQSAVFPTLKPGRPRGSKTRRRARVAA
jgi:hypothetical protein